MVEALGLTIALAILFDISNGWNDSANAIATVVSTRVLSPRSAVFLAASMNILGAYSSTAVAKTIGSGIVDPSAIMTSVVATALVVGFLWNAAMTVLGFPVSASHALIGSMMGATAAFAGAGILNPSGLAKIFASLLLSPLIGIVFGFGFMKLIRALA